MRTMLIVVTNRKIPSPLRESNLGQWPAFSNFMNELALFLYKNNSINFGLSDISETKMLPGVIVSGF
jgi:hypothetical protein